VRAPQPSPAGDHYLSSQIAPPAARSRQTQGARAGPVRLSSRAIPELLRALDLAGCLVTINAIGCQTTIAQLIVAQNADHLLAQGQSGATLRRCGAPRCRPDGQPEPGLPAGLRQNERQRSWPDRDSPSLDDQRPAGAHALTPCQPVCAFDDRDDGAPRTTLRRRRLSRAALLHFQYSHQRGPAAAQQTAALAHRELPTLDPGNRVSGGESRLRKDHGTQNFAILRHIALNLLQQETTCKLCVFNKRLKAAWDLDYLRTVLATLFK
jgi:predicted transposase YbfD/YdcC